MDDTNYHSWKAGTLVSFAVGVESPREFGIVVINNPMLCGRDHLIIISSNLSGEKSFRPMIKDVKRIELVDMDTSTVREIHKNLAAWIKKFEGLNEPLKAKMDELDSVAQGNGSDQDVSLKGVR